MNREAMTRDEWNRLRYRVELQELSEEEGGGWMAWIPVLGKAAFMVDAETAADALDKLEAHRRAMYDLVVKDGRAIPLPSDVSDEPLASGKWLQRASRRLHAEMREAAEKDGVSFNTYCENAMTRGHLMMAAAAAMDNLAEGICDDFRLRVAREAKQARYELRGVSGADIVSDPGYEQIELEGWHGRKTA